MLHMIDMIHMIWFIPDHIVRSWHATVLPYFVNATPRNKWSVTDCRIFQIWHLRKHLSLPSYQNPNQGLESIGVYHKVWLVHARRVTWVNSQDGLPDAHLLFWMIYSQCSIVRRRSFWKPLVYHTLLLHTSRSGCRFYQVLAVLPCPSELPVQRWQLILRETKLCVRGRRYKTWGMSSRSKSIHGSRPGMGPT